MERILEGRTALITGSTSGIGHGIALLYAQAGAKVMLNGFGKPEDIAKARAEIGAAMGVAEAPYSAADLSKPEAVRQMVKDAEAALGQVDILVNNAGTSSSPRLMNSPRRNSTRSSRSTSSPTSTPSRRRCRG